MGDFDNLRDLVAIKQFCGRIAVEFSTTGDDEMVAAPQVGIREDGVFPPGRFPGLYAGRRCDGRGRWH
ncbi:hypothetical protein [Pseudogemmobacter bohemicus]|uniref:hypothetical protein n=1 Tax=Pseudogemmobacter bohemicus TaxID=2250708 RepID=UPI000DD31EF2|nr:hypothetical protein [Pseudogemmobacter bohemicus]